MSNDYFVTLDVDDVANLEYNLRLDFKSSCMMKAAGFPQPNLGMGQVWYNPQGYASEVVDGPSIMDDGKTFGMWTKEKRFGKMQLIKRRTLKKTKIVYSPTLYEAVQFLKIHSFVS